MVGLPPSDTFPGNPALAAYASTVRCVVSWYGVGDFTLSSARGPTGRANFKKIFGKSYDEEPDLYRHMSPVSHLAQGAVPILLLTGDKDTTILPEQSESLHQRAQSVGLDSNFVLVSNSGHGWRPLGGPILPSQEEIHRITADFIRKHTSRIRAFVQSCVCTRSGQPVADPNSRDCKSWSHMGNIVLIVRFGSATG